jgi:hypothetical protein
MLKNGGKGKCDLGVGVVVSLFLCSLIHEFFPSRFGPLNDSPFSGHNNIITVYWLIITLIIMNTLPNLTTDGKYV